VITVDATVTTVGPRLYYGNLTDMAQTKCYNLATTPATEISCPSGDQAVLDLVGLVGADLVTVVSHLGNAGYLVHRQCTSIAGSSAIGIVTGVAHQVVYDENGSIIHPHLGSQVNVSYNKLTCTDDDGIWTP
jgi:hypothetical protein